MFKGCTQRLTQPFTQVLVEWMNEWQIERKKCLWLVNSSTMSTPGKVPCSGKNENMFFHVLGQLERSVSEDACRDVFIGGMRAATSVYVSLGWIRIYMHIGTGSEETAVRPDAKWNVYG